MSDLCKLHHCYLHHLLTRVRAWGLRCRSDPGWVGAKGDAAAVPGITTRWRWALTGLPGKSQQVGAPVQALLCPLPPKRYSRLAPVAPSGGRSFQKPQKALAIQLSSLSWCCPPALGEGGRGPHVPIPRWRSPPLAPGRHFTNPSA